MDWELVKVADQSRCGASLGDTKAYDPVFVDDAVILMDALKVLLMALDLMY